MSFYLFLPSNVSPRYFPNNRISCFNVKLPKRLKFKPNEYEVALTEITYVHSMKTYFNEDDRVLWFYGMNNVKRNLRILPNQNYSSIETLCTELNLAFTKDDKDTVANVWHSPITNRVTFTIHEGEILLPEKISKNLGFGDETKFFGDQSPYVASMPPDHAAGMYHLFVYCDFVEEQIVGDSLVPLLRIVNITGMEGEVVTQTFRPYYLPVNKLDFDTIEILLCNEFGEEILFDKGSSIVTVHFRKKSTK